MADSADLNELAKFLRLRPDLAQPAPATLGELRHRAQRPASVRAALGRLRDRQLRVLLGLAAQLDPSLLAEQAGGRLPIVLTELAELGLVTGEPPRPTAIVRAVLGRYPAGLAPASGQPLASELVTAKMAGLSGGERAVLDRLVWGPPVGRRPSADESGPVARLLEMGLLVPAGADAVLLPREVALVLRRGQVFNQRPTFASPDEASEPLSVRESRAVARRLLEPAPLGGYAVLTRAHQEDRWVDLSYATEDGTTLHEVVRVLTIAHGSAYLVRRHGPRLTVPLKRVVQARLGDAVVISGDPTRRAPSTRPPGPNRPPQNRPKP